MRLQLQLPAERGQGLVDEGARVPPAQPLDLGNSGTGMRLMAGILAAQRFASTLVGDESLSRRPMKRVVEPLRRMGASIATREGGLAPLAFAPVDALKAIDLVTDVPSAQVKSCVLLAGLHATGTTRVREAHATRDHSERMLRAFGVDVRERDGWIEVDGGARLEGTNIDVPGDFSSAAFFLVAASLVPGSDLVIERVGVNPLRTGLLQALWAMGANIDVENERVAGAEPIADLRVRAAALHGIEVPEALVPDMIDEFPVLFIAAAYAEGRTVLRGVEELRVKESDRIQVMADGLQALGAQGVKLGIDDFGTGYSSLSHLSTLPLDCLKIDRSFVSRLETSTNEAAVVRSIILLGSSLGKTVVAEGIETTGQMAQLRGMGCRLGQGFLLARPLTAQDVSSRLGKLTSELHGPAAAHAGSSSSSSGPQTVFH